MSSKLEINRLIDTNKTNNSLKSYSTSNVFDHSDIDWSQLDEKEKKIVNEFIYLLDKSRQLFNGLRELPQYGHKNCQWNTYFARTFDVYTKLWKFQQQNRQILEQKYNLKRWQIGEIASKIGQLYYHYYLRTSESNYLKESYSFYQAIQSRAYYSKANKEEKPDLMVKKLRFYARFIVVCLLLKKTKQVRDLIRELGRQIDDYVKIYDPEDQLEWQLVKNEINDFLEADSLLNIDNENLSSFSNRLVPSHVPVIGPNTMMSYTEQFKSQLLNNSMNSSSLFLAEIIIVGNCHNQIKFSELSLDMYRMLQSVEREPSPPSLNETKLQNITNEKSMTTSLIINDIDKNASQSIIHRENPHKYLLYKPSFSQFYTYVSSAFKDLSPHSVLMIYLSADACESQSRAQIEHAYDFGGVRTNSKKDVGNLSSSMNGLGLSHSETHHRKSNLSKEPHCIFPGDLYPFSRKPIFLIVDSSNSFAFKNFPNLFGQPFLSLLAPQHLPPIFQERQHHNGNLFTLFLTNPLFAFCYICNISSLTGIVYSKSQDQISAIFIEIARTFYKNKQIESVFFQFSADDFLRVFIFRFVFCYCSLKLHRGFKGTDYYPSSQPQLPNEIIDNKSILKMIIELASILNIRQLFLEINDDE
ncbi:SCAI isoform X2 [Brachionus plicatilis]|uniref:SCAI isoform X2 n=1 Tax=Brachionus plicatilis TaxID=10195 RepID=A0A3M7SL91_BRAPC|nr:SCAI isoform X2 [Brachionus plicatilis]